jgi:hypothetical protein
MALKGYLGQGELILLSYEYVFAHIEVSLSMYTFVLTLYTGLLALLIIPRIKSTVKFSYKF